MFFVPNGTELLKFPTNEESAVLPHFNTDRRHFDPENIKIFSEYLGADVLDFFKQQILYFNQQ